MSSNDLESLDNKTLRAKCLEYGLPNVPITDTSKKLLIRKLRAAMDGTTTDKGKSVRRETIHVTQATSSPKHSTPKKDTPKKIITNNRRTIAATPREEEVPVRAPAFVPEPVTQRRRSSRGTPVEHIIPITVQSKPTSQPIIEENDFDDDFILIDDDTPEMYSAPAPMTSYRKSRSPSLGKSAIITTSYKKEIPLPQKTIPENDSESDEDLPPSPIGRSKIQEYTSKSFIPNHPKETSVPRYSQPATYLNRSSIDKEEYPVGYKSIYPTLTTVAPETTKYYDNTTATTTRRYTTSGLTTQPNLSTKRIAATQQHYTENSDSNEDAGGVEEDAPYLSDFARRLSRLKAEPLDIGYKKDLSELREHRYGSSAVAARRTNYSARRNSTVADSFKEFWFALDYKYNIMRKLIILCLLGIVILSLYIYSHYTN